MSRYFTREEFHCRCDRPECDALTDPDPALMALLDNIREELAAPLVITSGLRCVWWNEHEHGEPHSGHLMGTEVDLSCPSALFRFRLLHAVFSRNIRRIGIGKHFVHVGIATNLPRDVVWTYYP